MRLIWAHLASRGSSPRRRDGQAFTARMTLRLAGFHAGKTVLSPAIGGSIGNAVTQLARASGAKHAMSSTTNHAKAGQATALGFNEVIDTSVERLADGVRRITGGFRGEHFLHRNSRRRLHQ